MEQLRSPRGTKIKIDEINRINIIIIVITIVKRATLTSRAIASKFSIGLQSASLLW